MSFGQGSWTGEVYTDSNGNNWRKYDSFSEATIDFGKMISETYFSNERNSVVAINDLENYDTAYCGGEEAWTSNVLSVMSSIYKEVGVNIYDIEYDGDSTVAEFALKFLGANYEIFTHYRSNDDNYRTFFDMQATFEGEWCAMFVSYCYDQCGLIPDVLPHPFRGCEEYQCMDEQTDRWVKASTGYIPNPGDIIIFFYSGYEKPSHTGIVTECNGVTVCTIEGNTGGTNGFKTSQVNQREYPINSSSIFGYFSL